MLAEEWPRARSSSPSRWSARRHSTAAHAATSWPGLAADGEEADDVAEREGEAAGARLHAQAEVAREVHRHLGEPVVAARRFVEVASAREGEDAAGEEEIDAV